MVFSEAETTQASLVERLTGLGWEHVPANHLDRAPEAVLDEADLIGALIRLNPIIAEKPERVDEILPRLRAVVMSAQAEGLLAANERMMSWMRGEETFKFVGTDDYEPVRLIDFDDSSNNHFVVSGPGHGHTGNSTEVTFGHGPHSRRFDVVLWANGIPVSVGETKSPVNVSVSWLNGASDIHDVYEKDCAPFFVPNILSWATEGREFHFGPVGQNPENWQMWGNTDDPHDLTGPARVLRSVDLLLRPEQLLSILRDYTLFDRPLAEGGRKLVKLIPRYPQVEAVEAIHQRVLDSDRNQGLIWHYQGSGKTLAMAYGALKLIHEPRIGAPTIICVLDRIDLVEQTLRQFKSVKLPQLSVGSTKRDLQRKLAEGQRGIIVTTVFRFEDADELSDRDNIIVLVDEAHRTQEGKLGQDMRTAMPNGQFFGLTGTPVADEDRDTFRLFGEPDDEGWVLNKYSMARSVADGATVPIHVEQRLVDEEIDEDALDDAFDKLADEEGLTEEEKETVAEKASSTKTLMLNPSRIEAVCEDLLDHFYAKIDPLGMKAQVVVYDRDLCIAYHKKLVELLEERGSDDEAEVVMTVDRSKDDWAVYGEYQLTDDEEAKLKQRFNDHDDPLKFLIVTAKLLTGFDAPLEGVMYLDRPLRLHSLSQAMARVNRRWAHPETGQEKRYGLIVDYVGLGAEIKKALQDASPEDSGKRPVEVDELIDQFYSTLQATLKRFEGIDRTEGGFEALQEAQERLTDEDAKEDFARQIITLQGLWEFLYPSARLSDYRDDYRWLVQVYESIRPTTASDKLLWAKLGSKTLNLVHEHTDVGEIRKIGAEAVLDEETIEAIKDLAEADPRPKTRSVDEGPITLDEALETIEARLKRRLESSGEHPVYQSLSERLERLRKRHLEDAEASQEFLKELLELARKMTEAVNADREGNLDDVEVLPDPRIGALTQIFREYAPDDTPVVVENVVRDIDEIVRQVRFTGWTDSHEGDRLVRREIRQILKKYELPLTGELFERTYEYIRENY